MSRATRGHPKTQTVYDDEHKLTAKELQRRQTLFRQAQAGSQRAAKILWEKYRIGKVDPTTLTIIPLVP